MKKIWLTLLMVIPASACTSNNQEEILSDAAEYSSVSVTLPGFDPPAGSAFAWYSPIVWASEAVKATDELNLEVTGLVEQGLLRKGYRIVSSPAQADYIIGGAVVDGNTTESEQVKAFFSLYPSLGEGITHALTTTAMVGVVEAADFDRIGNLRSNELLWRSSIELFVVGESLTAEQQHARLSGLAGRLMSSLP